MAPLAQRRPRPPAIVQREKFATKSEGSCYRLHGIFSPKLEKEKRHSSSRLLLPVL